MPNDIEQPEKWRLAKRLLDVYGETRSGQMDKYGVGHMILSITSPGPQGEADQANAEGLAERGNDYMG